MYQRVVQKCIDQTADISIYKRNRDLLYNALTDMGYECVYPDGAFYLFVKAMEEDSQKFCEEAKKHELLLVSYCVQTEQIENALPEFKALAESYQK